MLLTVSHRVQHHCTAPSMVREGNNQNEHFVFWMKILHALMMVSLRMHGDRIWLVTSQDGKAACAPLLLTLKRLPDLECLLGEWNLPWIAGLIKTNSLIN